MRKWLILLSSFIYLSCAAGQNVVRLDNGKIDHSFICIAPGAHEVFLESGTNVYPMSETSSGEWRLTLRLPEGKFRYLFVIDGEAQTDPRNPWMEQDGAGGYESVVAIGSTPDYKGYRGDVTHGEVLTVVIDSRELEARQTFRVYLPPDYNATNRAYPVLFLLHGIWANQNFWTWSGGGAVQNYMDNMIADGVVEPFVIVMPFGANSFYTNRYERLIVNELYEYATNHYRILAGRQFTGIGGYSMGGFGAFYLAMRNPGRFGISIPISGYFNYPRFLKLYDDTPLTFEPELVLFCGTTDPLCYPTVMNLKTYLDRDGVDYKLYTSPGIHQWSYWNKVEPDVLRFASEYFYRGVTNS